MSKPLAAPPDVIRWCARSGDHGDCAIAALAMACGVTYEIALGTCLTVEPKVLTEGMYWRNLKRAAQRLGYVPRTIPFGQLDFGGEHLTGILELESTHSDTMNHVVYIWHGRIIEPKFDRQELWEDPEQFFNHYGYRVARMLTVEVKEDV